MRPCGFWVTAILRACRRKLGSEGKALFLAVGRVWSNPQFKAGHMFLEVYAVGHSLSPVWRWHGMKFVAVSALCEISVHAF